MSSVKCIVSRRSFVIQKKNTGYAPACRLINYRRGPGPSGFKGRKPRKEEQRAWLTVLNIEIYRNPPPPWQHARNFWYLLKNLHFLFVINFICKRTPIVSNPNWNIEYAEMRQSWACYNPINCILRWKKRPPIRYHHSLPNRYLGVALWHCLDRKP